MTDLGDGAGRGAIEAGITVAWAQLLPSLPKPQRPLVAAGAQRARLIWEAALAHTP